MTFKIALPDLVSNSYFPAIAAVELGFFKDEGLDAEIELIFPVPASYEALRDGKADFVAGSAHAPLWAGCASGPHPALTWVFASC
jgi:ABC-type nitrate/sulfonate/bicarbonate transport system substrate-binding protein